MEKTRTARSHYKFGINGELTEKIGYETEKDALMMARFLNTKPNIMHKMVAYKCIKCNKWHIGSNGRLLTEEDREIAKEKLKRYGGTERHS